MWSCRLVNLAEDSVLLNHQPTALNISCAETLKPIRPEDVEIWEKIAVILNPEEIKDHELPAMLIPPESMLCAGNIKGCRLMVEQNRILGS